MQKISTTNGSSGEKSVCFEVFFVGLQPQTITVNSDAGGPQRAPRINNRNRKSIQSGRNQQQAKEAEEAV
ncbi:hypothetical protein ACLKA6_015702 [Drosophila palustris]